MINLDELLVTRNWIGQPVRRNEDIPKVTGDATYVDDINLDTASVAFVRSPHPHARIVRVDTSAAESLPGVLAVITGQDIKQLTNPIAPRAITQPVIQYVMAVDKVRYPGEPIAAVAAVDEYVAEDAAALIEVEYEPLQPVVTIDDAIAPGAPLVFEEAGTNLLLHDKMEHGNVAAAFAEADFVVKDEFRVQRFSSTPLEPWAIIARHEPNDAYTVWSNDQQPGRSAINVTKTLGIPLDKVRLIVPDSGGGFGIKLAIWPYMVILCVLSRKVDKPIKWIQTRTEHLLAGTHTPETVINAELGVKRDGTFTGLRLESKDNDGSFVHTAGLYALIKFATMVGCYRIKATSYEFSIVVTNKAPTVQNRGVGKPGMMFDLERLVNKAAQELKIDAAEIRFRNFVQPNQMPYKTPSGEIYESGDFPASLQQALDLAGYEDWKQKRDELRNEGRYLGVGMACGVEPGTSNLGYYYISRGQPDFLGNAEGAIVSVDFDGHISALLGSVDAGQGHATTVAQIIADMLAIRPENVTLNTHFDSLVSPLMPHSGTYSNRFNDVEVGAVIRATEKVRAKLLKIAAHVLETPVDQLQLRDGRVCSTRDEARSMTFAEIAAYAYKKPVLLPEDVEPGLKEIAYYQNKMAKVPQKDDFNIQLTHSNGVHIVVVEVDVKTGFITFHKYVIVHDCGRQLNPGIVDGMVIGSTVHGIGAALLEEFVYSEDGQMLSASFMDYLKPLPMALPHFELGSLESDCPYTLLGTKAVGEGGAITSLPAIANAVEDALTPFGVRVTSLPLTPQKVLKAIQTKGVI